MDLTKKERRQLRREERRQAHVSSARGRKLKTLVVWAAIILAAAGLAYWGYYYFLKISQIPEIGEVFPIEGANHVAEGTEVEYKTNPPASGDHYGVPANWGVYDHKIPDEAAVHNLEHGGVWIAYHPRIPDEVRERLAEMTRKSSSKVILTPREANDADIALVSWGRIYKTESFDEEKIRNFIFKYENTGPERAPKSMPGKDY